jgi:hypothetical protein
MQDDGFCPISHIAVRDLRMPVVFQGFRALVIYDAEHAVGWLRHCMRNPMSSASVEPGLATDILTPYRLAHTTDQDLERTRAFLQSAGYLGGSRWSEAVLPVLIILNLAIMYYIEELGSHSIVLAGFLQWPGLLYILRTYPESFWSTVGLFVSHFAFMYIAEYVYWLSFAPPGTEFNRKTISCAVLRGYLDYCPSFLPTTPMANLAWRAGCAQ